MDNKKEPITRQQMLQMLDIRRTPEGKPIVYSAKFVEASGKLRFFPQCIVCGAGRMNMKQQRVRGLQPCDCKGTPDPGTHVYPVRIDNILEFNGHKVVCSLIPNL